LPAPTPPSGRALGGLGARLRAVREAAGLSGSELAAALGAGWRQSKISKIETGRQLPTVEEITAWATATDIDPAPLAALRTKASAEYDAWKDRIAGVGGALALQDEITALAASCRFLGEYQSGLVPGRLQTPAYMREMALGNEFLADNDITPDILSHVIAAKIRRQSILYEPGREIVHVVGEAALHTRIGKMTVRTLRGQLAHLAEMALLPGHTFGVVPFAVASPVGACCWSMYDRDLVIVETIAGDLQLTEPEAVARYSRWLDQLLDVALTGEQAAEFCREVARTLPDPT
jgi:transcriptional regulator with XRE-family HTH domain